MADYLKVEVKATYSKKSDFSSPKVVFEPAAYNPTTGPDEYKHLEVECDVGAAGAGTTVFLSEFASVDQVHIKNNDATNKITVRFRTAANFAASPQTVTDLEVAAGKAAVLTDVNAAFGLDLAATGAVVEAEVFAVGT